MTSEKIDYDALAATTRIEDMTDDDCESNQETLRSLKSGRLLELQICNQPIRVGEYGVLSDKELGWLGYFVKKNTSLVKFGIHGFNALGRCSEQAVDEFFDDLGRSSACINFVYFSFTNVLPRLINKLGPVMKNNGITGWSFSNCTLGNPEVTSLFGLIRDMEKPNGLHIVTMNNHHPTDNDYHLDDDVVSEGIPSLASKASMQKLTLRGLKMGRNSCNALSTVFPQMADLIQLDLGQNEIDDNSVEILVRGLAGCIHLRDLSLNDNLILDDGFDVLIRGLPASVDALALPRNLFELDRELSLMRFKILNLSGNCLAPSGIMAVAESLANPECCLKCLDMSDLGIIDEEKVLVVGDEEVAIMARALQKNRTLIQLVLSMPWVDDDITESGWGAFSSVLCDDSSINATHSSNHTLCSLGQVNDLPQDVRSFLDLNNSGEDESRIAAKKILRAHRHLVKPLLSWELDLLPYVVAWLERFAETRLDLKLSSFYEFVRAIPLKIVDRMGGKTKGKKRKLCS